MEINRICHEDNPCSLHSIWAKGSIPLIEDSVETGELVMLPSSFFVVETVTDTSPSSSPSLKKSTSFKKSAFGISDKVVNQISFNFSKSTNRNHLLYHGIYFPWDWDRKLSQSYQISHIYTTFNSFQLPYCKQSQPHVVQFPFLPHQNIMKVLIW